jgi:hypothetical protein
LYSGGPDGERKGQWVDYIIFLLILVGNPWPKSTIYTNITAAIKILLSSAMACFCPNRKVIIRYKINPMITECTIIVNPLSIFFVVGFGGWFGVYIKLGFLVMRGGVWKTT